MEGLHVKSTWLQPMTVAANPVGVVGLVVSDSHTGVVALEAELSAESLPALS